MISICKGKRGFTLIELLVVVGMIAVLLGAMTTSVSAARARARVQKAISEVKVITQAILSFENWSQNGEFELPTYEQPVPTDAAHLDFLLGKKQADSNGNVPVLLMAQLRSGGQIVDPWGHPYQVKITKKSMKVTFSTSNIKTGYYLPNFYRLGEGERNLEAR